MHVCAVFEENNRSQPDEYFAGNDSLVWSDDLAILLSKCKS